MLILTTFDLDEYAFAGLRAGASGFLLKNVPPEELVAAIRTVASGDAVVAPRVTRRLLETFAESLPIPAGDEQPDDRLAALTEREREVLGSLALGQTNLEIAAALHLSEATVKTHVSRILSKLGLRDRVQAVVFAYETRLVRPAPSRQGPGAPSRRRGAATPSRPPAACRRPSGAARTSAKSPCALARSMHWSGVSTW